MNNTRIPIWHQRHARLFRPAGQGRQSHRGAIRTENAANLFTGRGGKLMDAAQAVQGPQDFELVTWLVIK